MIQIPGVATIGEREFHFDSGYPTDKPILPEAQNLRGQLQIQTNGSVDFVDGRRIYLPPEVHHVARGENYTIKRTSRHYIIQLKVPVVESRIASQRSLQRLLPVIVGEITLDRRETLSPVLA